MAKRKPSRKRKNSGGGRKTKRRASTATFEAPYNGLLGGAEPAAPSAGHAGTSLSSPRAPGASSPRPPGPLPMPPRPISSKKPGQKSRPASAGQVMRPEPTARTQRAEPTAKAPRVGPTAKTQPRSPASHPKPATQPKSPSTQPRSPAGQPKTPPSQPRTPAKPARGEQLTQAQIYETLAALLVPYARKMESEMHPKIGFCLKAKSARTGRETHFGAVQALPDGVAYHLFPLYGHPDLLENVSPDLFNRMRGKTCFHFDELHAGLVAELAQLTHAGFERFLADGVLQ